MCIKDQVVRLQFPQTWAAILYILFRIIERFVFAVYTQTSRELLKVEPKTRNSATHCCVKEKCEGKYLKMFDRCICYCPTGIYKQMWLRFFGSFFGVVSFFLILEQNIIMFVAVVFIDVAFERVRFQYQPKDHDLGDDFHHADLAWFVNESNFEKLDLDEDWLRNFKLLMAKYKSDEKIPDKPVQSIPLKYF